jgi:rRNA maturation protein Nop10
MTLTVDNNVIYCDKCGGDTKIGVAIVPEFGMCHNPIIQDYKEIEVTTCIKCIECGHSIEHPNPIKNLLQDITF